MAQSVNFKFPKVVLAHILGEVGTFCTVSLNVYSRTCVPTLIEISAYLSKTHEHFGDVKNLCIWA